MTPKKLRENKMINNSLFPYNHLRVNKSEMQGL